MFPILTIELCVHVLCIIGSNFILFATFLHNMLHLFLFCHTAFNLGCAPRFFYVFSFALI